MADLFLLLGLCVLVVSAEIRGIDPSQTGLYNKQRFVCFDNSREIPYAAVNDDYCDCLDGSDEPGTSACVEGVFYCRNKGHLPSRIASIFVDDGFCDCCDGSDEKHIPCPHTCLKLGEKLRAELKEKIDIYKRSLRERQRRANAAGDIQEQWKSELKTCQEDIERQQARCTKIKTRLDILEAEEKQKEEEKEATNNTTDHTADVAEPDIDVDDKANGDATDSTEEGEAEIDTTVEAVHDDDENKHNSEDQEGVYDEDREGVEYTDQSKTETRVEDDDDGDEEGLAVEGLGEEKGEDPSEGNHPEAPSKEAHSPRFLSRLKTWGRSLWPSAKKSKKKPGRKADIPVENLQLQQLRTEHSKEKKELRNLEQRRDDLRTKLDGDYGTDGRFVSLADQCFEGKQDKYTYVICPFDRADQKEGHRQVTLGRFDGFTDDYQTMHFKRGQRCPGKQRSLTVELQCGEEEHLQSVEEPAMCEYTAAFLTPVACTESELEQLYKEARLMGVEVIEVTETRTDQDNFKDEL